MKTIFRGASLLSEAEAVQKRVNVAVAGNTIVKVTSDNIEADADDTVVDLDGRTLMPGLIVCHLHPEFGLFDFNALRAGHTSGTIRPLVELVAISVNTCHTLLASGVTGYVGGGGPFDIDAGLKMAVDDGVLPGPRIMPASHHLGTSGSHLDGMKWWYDMRNKGGALLADGPEDMRKLVRQEIRRGARIIKLHYSGGHGSILQRHIYPMSRDELDMLVRTAHERGAKVRAHCAWEDRIRDCIEAGVDVIDHGDEMNEELLDLMAARGTFWTPSIVQTKAFIDGMAEHTSREQTDPAEHDFPNIMRLLPYAQRKGVRILTGDDYGLSFAPHKPGIYGRELSIYAQNSKVHPRDILRWATQNGAELMGLGGRLGTVAEGAIADLIVLNADPVADITILENPAANLAAVMANGVFTKLELKDRSSSAKPVEGALRRA